MDYIVGQGPIALAWGGGGGYNAHWLAHTFSINVRCGRVVRLPKVNFQCWGVLLIWIIVGQRPVALAVGAGGGCLDIFLSSVLSLLFLPLFGRRPDID